MIVIISRKGFDSSSGGVPSPIFFNGKMLSLPIPDKHSKIQHKDTPSKYLSFSRDVAVENAINKDIL